jgi:secondary thiamine-phosphate synthase enzyme
MTVRSMFIQCNTRGNADIIDISGQVSACIQESGIREGIVTIFCPSATSAVTTIEYEPGCLSDLRRALDELASPQREYDHDQAWGDGNGHSHLRAALLKASLTVPFTGARMTLGTWQQIVFIDFDNRPRRREIVVQVMGD